MSDNDSDKVHLAKIVDKKISLRLPRVFDIDTAYRVQLLKALVKTAVDRGGIDDPEIWADKVLERCLAGKASDGKTWFNAPKTLGARLRVYGFNIETMSGIEGFMNRATAATRDYHRKSGSKGVKRRSNVPKEINLSGKCDTDNTTALLSTEEMREYRSRFSGYLKHFPFLNNPADLAILELLVRLEIASLRRLNAVLNTADTRGLSKSEDKNIADNIRKLQETLGIAGNQRMKLMGNITQGTVADLVQLYEAYVKDGKYLEVEWEWWKEEAALLLRKADRFFPNEIPEITDAVFVRLMGVDMKTAKLMIDDPYSRTLEDAKKRAWQLLHEVDRDAELAGR